MRRAARSPRVATAAAGSEPLGLALVVAGLAALVLAFPLHSLAALFASALLGGAGHGLAFLGAQAEINDLAPIERRGEVTAAFISCIYSGVAISAIGVGLLSTALSLRAAVTIFAIVGRLHGADRDRLAPQRADQGSAGGSLSSAELARDLRQPCAHLAGEDARAVGRRASTSAASAGRSRAKRSARPAPSARPRSARR